MNRIATYPAGTLQAPMAAVAEFHAHFATNPAPTVPIMQNAAQTKRRSDWIREEMDELLEARDITEQADAYIDAIYFAFGGLIELGLDPSPLFDIVHDANMAKGHVIDGELVVIRDPGNGNKVVKPVGWKDPKPLLTAEVVRQIREAQIAEQAAESGLPEHVVRKVADETATLADKLAAATTSEECEAIADALHSLAEEVRAA